MIKNYLKKIKICSKFLLQFTVDFEISNNFLGVFKREKNCYQKNGRLTKIMLLLMLRGLIRNEILAGTTARNKTCTLVRITESSGNKINN